LQIQAQFSEETMGVYAHGIDAIYHPHTTQKVLPGNVWIPEAIRYLYDAYVRLTVGSRVSILKGGFDFG